MSRKEFSKHPAALTKLFWFLGSNPTMFLPLVTLAVMLVLWYSEGRDPDPGISVAPHVRAAGRLFSRGMRNFARRSTSILATLPSTIVDLAVRGYLKIEEVEDKGLVFQPQGLHFPPAQARDAVDRQRCGAA